MPTIPTILGQDPWPVSGPAPVDIDSQQDRGTALKDTPSPAVLSDSSLSQYIFVRLRHEVEVASHVLSFNRNRMQQADDAIDVLFYLWPFANYQLQLPTGSHWVGIDCAMEWRSAGSGVNSSASATYLLCGSCRPSLLWLLLLAPYVVVFVTATNDSQHMVARQLAAAGQEYSARMLRLSFKFFNLMNL